MQKLAHGLLIVALSLTGCGLVPDLGPSVTVSIVYGSEKREWLAPLVEAYNASGQKTASGATIKIEATAMGSIEAVDGILAGSIQPTVWSPASSLYIPLANERWRQSHSGDLVTGNPSNLVLSPVVIAMWRPMAEALGWPATELGWSDIAKLATSEAGWAAYGYPEWGRFKFGHTHPEFSNSGLSAVLAQAYAGAGNPRTLTADGLSQAGPLMTEIQSSLIHYGTSTGFFGERMFERGPSYLSAAVLYENLVVAQESKRLAGQSQQLSVVAIYPKEGTFTANHPYIVLSASWVTDEQREAAEAFEAFLLDRPQQLKALELGFRPADVGIPFTAPLDVQHGVDTSQPRNELAAPDAATLEATTQLWRENKKPVDLVAVIDISGSMGGDKIAAARTSLSQFIGRLADQDRIQVIAFNDTSVSMGPLAPLVEVRQDLQRRVGAISESGGTALYDAVGTAVSDLAVNGDPNHIRAIVVLSDGEDTESASSLDQVLAQIGQSGEGGDSIKVFTIAFGGDASTDVLTQIAESTGARMYEGKPDDIERVYAEIATFF
ncbi:MAG: VWA domain-containing protein [Anaerolineales bacterium]|nr:VWA domain-containing protein [Anaerolineales bacterium]